MKASEIKMAIGVSARLQNCLVMVKKMFGEEYRQSLQFYIDHIKDYQQKFEMDELESVLAICNTDGIKDDGFATTMFLAAAIEMIVPTEK